jgi:NitT/TauT family transport system permease protein
MRRSGPRAVVLSILGVLLMLGGWWGITAMLPASSVLNRFAPGPSFQALVHLSTSGEVVPHIVASLRRILVGLLLAMVLGVPIGLIVGGIRGAADLSSIVFQFLRMVSPLAWAPLAIMIFGVGDAPVYFLVAMGTVWPIVLNVAAGVHGLDPRWRLLARSLGATRSETFRTIVWPGIRSHVLTGFRLAVGLAWVIVVPAEMLGVDSGLGYAVLNTRDRLAYSELMAMIVIIGACGYLMDIVVRWLVSEPWRRRLPRRIVERSATRRVSPARSG